MEDTKITINVTYGGKPFQRVAEINGIRYFMSTDHKFLLLVNNEDTVIAKIIGPYDLHMYFKK